jgi:two-component system chemotaxis response regulator CheV
LNVLKIKEIVTFTNLNKLPDSNPALAGVAELRCVTLPVIDLGIAMGLSPIETSSEHIPSIVVTECNGKAQGFLVRKVENIIPINWSDINAIPKVSGNNHYATGVISINEKLVTLIDVEKIMHETTDTADDLSSDLLTKTQLSDIQGKKLLVVDDSLIARKKIASTLDVLGLKYQLVDGAKGALSQLNETST